MLEANDNRAGTTLAKHFLFINVKWSSLILRLELAQKYNAQLLNGSCFEECSLV